MINEEILGGLKSALERGESLKRAMMTFYNAGYKKEQIEEAARFLNGNPSLVQQVPQSILEVPKPKKGLFQKEKKLENKSISAPVIPSIPASVPSATPQVISKYGEEKKPSKIGIIILVVALIFLFGFLVSIFVFRENITNFFSSLFG